MAWYKYPAFLKQNPGEVYDKDYPPGVAAPFAGIYRCVGCGREIGIAYGHALPPQTHHQHTAADGAICWQMIVWADHRPSGQQA